MNDLDATLLSLSVRGYCCSQILLRLALDLQGRENPELIRATAGLCNGLGQGAGTCGVLTGAACVLGLYVGKGQDDETPDQCMDLMLAELTEWFTERVQMDAPGIRCEDILGGPDRKPDLGRCGRLLQDTWIKTLEILQHNEIDPLEAR
jgi:hypothetical protein